MENDKMARLEEMLESMRQAISNVYKVKEQQSTLLMIVDNSSKKEMFEAFSKELNAQIADLDVQANKLSERLSLLEDVIDKCKVDESAKEIVLKVLDMFGIFEEN